MGFEELKIGQSYELSRSFSQQDIIDFAKLSGDTNPIHMDAAYAHGSQFGQLIVPGFLTTSLFSAIIGARFPGSGSIYLSQDVSFWKPVYPNQMVTARVTVRELFAERHRVLLETCCYDENHETLISGTALVKVP